MKYPDRAVNDTNSCRKSRRVSVRLWPGVAVAALLFGILAAVCSGGRTDITAAAPRAASPPPFLPVTPLAIREATGANAAAIQSTVDAFRSDLGTLRPNTRSSFTSGRREINWDGVPDASAAPANLPPDFFNTTSPRGAVFSTPGTGFQVSMDDDNPADADPDQVRFSNLNPGYATQFSVFSAQRLFTAVGSNITDVTFFVPGTNIPATVTAFGAVFTDVDSQGTTTIQLFDPYDNLLLIHSVLPTPGAGSLSFLGIELGNGQRISRVRITSGNSQLGPNDNPSGGVDAVAMDDFIYAEPQPAVCSPQTISGDIGQGSEDYPSTSGVQTNRVANNGVDSSCASPKTCPGQAINPGTFAFDAYQFANNSSATACVTFSFPQSCGASQAIHAVAYLGSFDPTSPCTNYLGDFGHNVDAATSGTFSVNVPANSIVVLVVHELGVQPDCSYSFSVSGLPPCFQAELPCPPATITGNIGQGSQDYPSTSGAQTNRIANNAVDSSCAAPKTCPGLAINPGTFTFDAYQFANRSNADACVTFSFPTACGPNQALHAVAYLGSYDPSNPCANYLGDFGHNVNASEAGTFSVTAPADSVIVLVVHELGTQPGCSYSFTVSGLPACPPAGGCTLTCPNNISVGTSPGVCGAAVGYEPGSPSGQCGAIVCAPPPGSLFPVGTTTVLCTEDGTIQICSFTVTVTDTTPPAITCPPNQIAAGKNPVVNYAAPAASDNCSVASVVCNPPSGSTFPLGTTTVTCTATDTAGNQASCQFTVMVFDVCLQDDSNSASVLLINSSTGEYRFCCGGKVFTGIGTVVKQGLLLTLTHTAIDRRLLAKVDFSVNKGSASLQSPPGILKCSITDRNITNNTCACY